MAIILFHKGHLKYEKFIHLFHSKNGPNFSVDPIIFDTFVWKINKIVVEWFGLNFLEPLSIRYEKRKLRVTFIEFSKKIKFSFFILSLIVMQLFSPMRWNVILNYRFERFIYPLTSDIDFPIIQTLMPYNSAIVSLMAL